ncbi:MAG: hypothetical protein KF884_05915 [Fimbriimonadaceae bacterium]|nr:hypothetical protein [Fimbriimonadaceae bacterium]QYK59621.1 MAG: hypothetical protein KF884_05915 [Fimbriimonadaceae bacterium]
MGATLLVSDARFSWREFTSAQTKVSLDVAAPESGPPGRVTVWSEGKLKAMRFVGTVDPALNPLAILSAYPSLASAVDGEFLVVTPSLADTPFGRHFGLSLAALVRPERVLAPAGSGLHEWPWPVGAEEIDLPHELPPLVREAQRRAQWMALLDRSTPHTVRLGEVALIGARLGSGRRVETPLAWAEVAGATLHMVADRELDDGVVASLMDAVHADKASHAKPGDYSRLICSFAHQDGEDFALGVIEALDLKGETLIVRSEAVAGAAPSMVKLGLMRIDNSGRELPPIRPWSL